MTVDETGVDETGVDKLGINHHVWSAHKIIHSSFHVALDQAPGYYTKSSLEKSAWLMATALLITGNCTLLKKGVTMPASVLTGKVSTIAFKLHYTLPKFPCDSQNVTTDKI